MHCTHFNTLFSVVTVVLVNQVLGTEELSAYLNKYHLELDSRLDALVGRFDIF